MLGVEDHVVDDRVRRAGLRHAAGGRGPEVHLTAETATALYSTALTGIPWRATYPVAVTREPVKAGAMGFSDDVPAPEPAPPRRHHP